MCTNNLNTFVHNMGENAKLENLLKNVQKELKKATDLFTTNEPHKAEIDHVLEVTAKYFEISVRILQHSKHRGDIQNMRSVSCWLLYYDLGLTTRYISTKVFKKKSNFRIWESIKSFKELNPDLKSDRELKQAYDNLKPGVQEYIRSRRESDSNFNLSPETP